MTLSLFPQQDTPLSIGNFTGTSFVPDLDMTNDSAGYFARSLLGGSPATTSALYGASIQDKALRQNYIRQEAKSLVLAGDEAGAFSTIQSMNDLKASSPATIYSNNVIPLLPWEKDSLNAVAQAEEDTNFEARMLGMTKEAHRAFRTKPDPIFTQMIAALKTGKGANETTHIMGRAAELIAQDASELGKAGARLIHGQEESGIEAFGAAMDAYLQAAQFGSSFVLRPVQAWVETHFDLNEDATIGDYIMAAKNMPIDPTIEAEMSDPVVAYVTGKPFDMDSWSADMEAKYGENFGKSFVVSMAKMGLQDAATLGAVAVVPALRRKFFAEQGASIWKRIGMAIKRAPVVGAGYAVQENALNYAAGLNTDLSAEFSLGAAGYLAGEGIGRGAAAIARPAINSLKLPLKNLRGYLRVDAGDTTDISDKAILDAIKVRAGEVPRERSVDGIDTEALQDALPIVAPKEKIESLVFQVEGRSIEVPTPKVNYVYVDGKKRIDPGTLAGAIDMASLASEIDAGKMKLALEKAAAEGKISFRIVKKDIRTRDTVPEESLANAQLPDTTPSLVKDVTPTPPTEDIPVRVDASGKMQLTKAEKAKYQEAATPLELAPKKKPRRPTKVIQEASDRADKPEVYAATKKELNTTYEQESILDPVDVAGDSIDLLDVVSRPADFIGASTLSQNNNRLNGVQDITEYFWKDADLTYSTSPLPFTYDPGIINKITGNLFADPSSILGPKAKDLAHGRDFEARMREFSSMAWNAAFDGIPKANINKIFSVREQLAHINAKEPGYRPTDLQLQTKFGLSKDEVDAFWAYDNYADAMYKIMDARALANAQKAGNKQISVAALTGDAAAKGRAVVEVIADKGKGQVLVRVVDRGNDIVTGEYTVSAKALTEPTAGILPRRAWYNPRRAEDKYKYFGAYVDKDTGKLEISHGYEILDDAVSNTDKLAAQYPNRLYFYGSKGDDLTQSFTGYGKGTARALESLTPENVAKIREALGDVGLDSAVADRVLIGFNEATFGALLNKKLAGARGGLLLGKDGKPIQYKPHDKAWEQYIREAASEQHRSVHKQFQIDFQKQYKEFLDPTKPWDQELPRTSATNPAKLNEAKEVQATIKRLLQGQSEAGRVADDYINNTMTAAFKRSPALEKTFNVLFGKWYEASNRSFAQGTTRLVRGTTSRLGFLGNTATFFAQFVNNGISLTGAELVSHPTALSGGVADMMAALATRAAEVTRSASHKINLEGAAGLRAYRRSGLGSELDLADLTNEMLRPSHVLDKYGFFFLTHNGEKINTVLNFFTARRHLMLEHKAGKLKNVDGTPFTGIIDDDAFIRLTVNRADVFRQRLTRDAKLKAFTGAGNILGQYMEPLAKSFRPYAAKELSLRERAGAFGAALAVVGPAGIPLVGDMTGLGDFLSWQVSDKSDINKARFVSTMAEKGGQELADMIVEDFDLRPDQKETVLRLLTKGGINAATAGEIDLTARFGQDALLSPMFKAIYEGNLMDSFPAASLLKRIMAEKGNIAESLDAYYTAYNLYTLTEGHAEDLQVDPSKIYAQEMAIEMGKIMNATGRVMPGIGIWADVMNNDTATRAAVQPGANTQGWLSKSGVVTDLGRPVNEADLWRRTMGILPAEVYKGQEVASTEREWGKYIEDILAHYRNKYKANVNDPDAKYRITNEAIQQITNIEDTLGKYQGALASHGKLGDNGRYQRGSMAEKFTHSLSYIDNDYMYSRERRSEGKSY